MYVCRTASVANLPPKAQKELNAEVQNFIRSQQTPSRNQLIWMNCPIMNFWTEGTNGLEAKLLSVESIKEFIKRKKMEDANSEPIECEKVTTTIVHVMCFFW